MTEIYCQRAHPRTVINPVRDDYEGQAKIRLKCPRCGADYLRHLDGWQQFMDRLVANAVAEISLDNVIGFDR